jgi:hypothetical protein
LPKSRSEPPIAKTSAPASRAPRAADRAAPSIDASTEMPSEPPSDGPHALPVTPEALPLVSLPSRFKPELFHKASASPGQRPVALKAVDAHLAAVDASTDPIERFEHMRQLQVAVDAFVRRHAKESSPRVAALFALKQWLDGAVDLRAPLFVKAAKAEVGLVKPDATPPGTLK